MARWHWRFRQPTVGSSIAITPWVAAATLCESADPMMQWLRIASQLPFQAHNYPVVRRELRSYGYSYSLLNRELRSYQEFPNHILDKTWLSRWGFIKAFELASWSSVWASQCLVLTLQSAASFPPSKQTKNTDSVNEPPFVSIKDGVLSQNFT